MIKEEEYVDDEYIDSKNDPSSVEKITKEDYTIPDDEEKIELDTVLENIKPRMGNLSNHDHIMEEKVLDALRKGILK